MKFKFILSPLLGLTLLAGCSDSQEEQPPMAVSVVAAEEQNTPLFREYVGQIQAQNDIAVRPRISGVVVSRNFQEGGMVRRGQPLFRIDAREYRAQVAAANAQLAAARADAARAAQDVARYGPLVEADAIAKQVYDTSVAASSAAKAQVSAARANVNQAEVALSYSIVRAPVSGQIGEANMDVGSLVSPTGPEMARVSDLNPIAVYFNPTEEELLTWQRQSAAQQNEAGTNLQLVLADGTEYPLLGRVDFANRALNPQTGSLELRAVFPNPNAELRPGMFGRIRLKYAQRDNAIIIPDRAVVEQLGSRFVYVVLDDNTVEQRQVEVGPALGGKLVINSGVKAGEKVLVDGLQKVQPGMTVDPKPFKEGGEQGGDKQPAAQEQSNEEKEETG